MTKSLADLGSQADQHKRNLHMLRAKERVAEDALTSLRAEIEAELSALQSLQDRAQAALEAIRAPGAQEAEAPAEPYVFAPVFDPGGSTANGKVQF